MNINSEDKIVLTTIVCLDFVTMIVGVQNLLTNSKQYFASKTFNCCNMYYPLARDSTVCYHLKQVFESETMIGLNSKHYSEFEN